MGARAWVYLQIERGGFATRGRAILFDLGPWDTFVIAAHEGWHQYTQTTFRDQLPVWLEEGVACYMEGFRWDPSDRTRPRFLPWANWERFGTLRRAARAGRLIPLGELTRLRPQDVMAERPQDALLYYAQVWAAVHFLNEGSGGRYAGALREMIADAAAGRLVARVSRAPEALGGGPRAGLLLRTRRIGADLLGVYTGRRAEELDAEYRAFVEAITRPGAGQALAAGRSPLAPAPARP